MRKDLKDNGSFVMPENKTDLLYAANVSVLKNKEFYDLCYADLSQKRREKTDRYAFTEDKLLSVGAQLLLKKALSDFGENFKCLDFDIEKNGKPYIKNRDNLFFNISHSGEYVLCAVSNKPVGCDIEKIKEADLKIAKRFFCESEYKVISDCKTHEAENEMFFKLWTLKESFVKLTGEGLKLPLDSFEIIFNKEIPAIKSFDGKSFCIFEYGNIKGYRCAFCTEKKIAKPQLKIINFR